MTASGRWPTSRAHIPLPKLMSAFAGKADPRQVQRPTVVVRVEFQVDGKLNIA